MQSISDMIWEPETIETMSPNPYEITVSCGRDEPCSGLWSLIFVAIRIHLGLCR